MDRAQRMVLKAERLYQEAERSRRSMTEGHARKAYDELLDFIEGNADVLENSRLSEFYTAIALFRRGLDATKDVKGWLDRAVELDPGNLNAKDIIQDILVDNEDEKSIFTIDDDARLEDVVLSDRPSEYDLLDIGTYKDTFVEMIVKRKLETPITIGIHGEWGTGKTTLMSHIKKELEKTYSDKVQVIWFDAWKYRKESNVWKALILLILKSIEGKPGLLPVQLDDLEDTKIRLSRSVERTVLGDVRIDLVNLAKKGIKLLGPRFEILSKAYDSVKDLLDVEDPGVTQDKLEKASKVIQRETTKVQMDRIHDIKDFYETFERLVRVYVRKTLVVFVDDLDRCMPDKAIEVLEAIKLFLDVKGCVFFIGVDNKVIEKGIEMRFTPEEGKPPLISGEEYINKVIQVPFFIPSIPEDKLDSYMRSLMGRTGADIQGEDEDEGDQEECIRIIRTGLEPNPRKVKSTLNTFKIMKHVKEARKGLSHIDDVSLTKYLVIQMKWKKFHERIARSPSIYERIERDIDTLISSDLSKEDILLIGGGNTDLLMSAFPEAGTAEEEPSPRPRAKGVPQEFQQSAWEALKSQVVPKRPTPQMTVKELPFDHERLKHIYRTHKGLVEFLVDTNGCRIGEMIRDLLSLSSPFTESVDVDITSMEEDPDTQLQMLLSDDPELVSEGVSNVLFMLDEEDSNYVINTLKLHLGSKNEDLRARAAHALGEIGEESAVKELSKRLKQDTSPSVRRAAASALAEIASDDSLKPLMSILADREEGKEVLCEAARALGGIGDRRAIGPLEDALEYPFSDVKVQAIQALGRLDARVSESKIREMLRREEYGHVVRAAVETLGRIGSRESVPDLLRMSDHNFTEVRIALADALGNLGDPKAIWTLVGLAFEDESHVVRRSAINAMGRIGTYETIELLAKMLYLEDDDLVSSATAALGNTGLPQAIEPLERLLGTGQERYERDAVQAIGEIGLVRGARVIREHYDTRLREHMEEEAALEETVLDTLPLSNLKEDTIEALGKIGSSESIPFLAGLLQDPDPDVRTMAARALGSTYDREAAAPLIEYMHDAEGAERHAAVWALVLVRAEEAVEAVTPLLHDEDPDMRAAAASVLATSRMEGAVARLVDRLEVEEDGTVAARILMALGWLKYEVPAHVLTGRFEDPDSEVVQQAIWAMGMTGGPGSADALVPLLENLDPAIRSLAAWALGMTGGPRHAQDLVSLLDDPYQDVRWNSALALGKVRAAEAVPNLLGLLAREDLSVRWSTVLALIIIGERAVDRVLERLFTTSEIGVGASRGPTSGVDPAGSDGEGADAKLLDETLERLVPRDARSTPAFLSAVAAVLAGLGRREASARMFDKAMALDDRDMDTLRMKGRALELLGDFEGGRDSFHTLVASRPMDSNAHNALAVMLGLLGRTEGALESVNTSLRLDRENENAVSSKAFVLGKMGYYYDDAVRLHRKSVFNLLDDPPTYYERASTEMAHHEEERALHYIGKGLECDWDGLFFKIYAGEFRKLAGNPRYEELLTAHGARPGGGGGPTRVA